MRFPRFFSMRSGKAKSSQPPPQSQRAQSPSDGHAGSAWSTALLMVGSALVGATAVAVWNRQTIADMRRQLDLEAGPRTSPSAPEKAPLSEEIF